MKRYYSAELLLATLMIGGGLAGLGLVWDYYRNDRNQTPIVFPTSPPITPRAIMTFEPLIYPPTLTLVGPATPWPSMTPYGMVCQCDANRYNCRDFDDQPAAQRCFDYCLRAGAGDVHRLDQDKDGLACDLR